MSHGADIRALLGIEHPIIQAPMAGSQGSALATAVCEAGGLGSLPCAMLSAEALRQELATIRSRTDRPFNVNFFCHAEPRADAPAEQAWRALLAPYRAQWGLAPEDGGTPVSRRPFSAQAAQVLAEFRPPVVSFHFGLPTPELLSLVRAWGARVLSTATTVAEARWLEARGADAVIAQGLEAGGHRGCFLESEPTAQLGTLALLPQVIDAVRIPVIAAGGIADHRGVAAALSLGAAGVQIGTSFLLCPEATTSATHRAALQSAAARHTALTNLFSGRPARGIVNRLMRELGPMNATAPAFPLAGAALSALRAKAEGQGCGDFSPLWAGQNVSGCRELPAAQLLRALLPR